MDILEFFNPLDINHLRAYNHLQKSGTWPADFIDWDNIKFPPNWHMLLQAKMADLWVGTNIFMHDMKPSEKPDGLINMDRLLNIAKNFKEKRKKDEGRKHDEQST
jgi:hypothetical protein